MTSAETVALFDKYVIGNYTRHGVVFSRGEGSLLWDPEGRRYIDLFPGWAVDGLGHCPPRVVAAIREQAGRLLHIANNYYTEPQGLLAKALSEISFGGKCFFCNSGAEANEAAIKCARLWGSSEGRGPGGARRYKIVAMENSFHGRTMGALSATGQKKYHQGVEPMLPGFVHVPFNDLAAAERAVDAETVAILLEPVQGEGGIHVARPEYMKGLRALCDEKRLLLVLDEVQTGMGRTGKWFAYEHYGVVPDLMTLAKSLGGGVAIGAMLGRSDVVAVMKPGTHASTFGGNPLAAAAALATIETIREENLLEHARRTGERLGERLERWRRRFPFVKEIRRLGLMAAAELDRPGGDIVRACIARGVLINCTHETVLRIIPATNVPQDLLDEGLDIVERVLAGG